MRINTVIYSLCGVILVVASAVAVANFLVGASFGALVDTIERVAVDLSTASDADPAAMRAVAELQAAASGAALWAAVSIGFGWVVTVVAPIVLLAMFIGGPRGISRPLGDLNAAMRRLALGDTTTSTKTNQTLVEIREMATASGSSATR